jgi:hypothetical protein
MPKKFELIETKIEKLNIIPIVEEYFFLQYVYNLSKKKMAGQLI